jgi:hypothetical protein
MNEQAVIESLLHSTISMFNVLPRPYESHLWVWTYQLSMVEEDPSCPSGQIFMPEQANG